MSPAEPAAGRRARALRTASLARSYGGRPALRDVDLTVYRGEVLGVMGSNGSGKSTLVRVLAGALGADAGRVERFPDEAPPPGPRRRRRAAVFDRSPFAECLSGLENGEALLRLRGHGGRAARERAARWLDRFGLGGRRTDPVAGYSRGMRRKADLAAAFATGAELLLLDEPAESLDAAARDVLADSLAERASGGGAAVATGHSAGFMERACHRVIFLRAGEVVARGRPADLIEDLDAEATIEVDVAGAAGDRRWPEGWPEGIRPVGRSGATLRFRSRNGGSALPEVCARILEAGGEIERVEVRRPDLDDAYLAAAGEPLGGEG